MNNVCNENEMWEKPESLCRKESHSRKPSREHWNASLHSHNEIEWLNNQAKYCIANKLYSHF